MGLVKSINTAYIEIVVSYFEESSIIGESTKLAPYNITLATRIKFLHRNGHETRRHPVAAV